jgi:hypothetical protein
VRMRWARRRIEFVFWLIRQAAETPALKKASAISLVPIQIANRCSVMCPGSVWKIILIPGDERCSRARDSRHSLTFH